MNMTARFPRAVTAFGHRKGDGVDLRLAEAAAALTAAGRRVAGLVQHAAPGEAECCDAFWLEDLASGARFDISQRLGRGARGCRLDYGSLAAAHASVAASLDAGADALIVNRFGYAEVCGGGLRPLIERAVLAGIPVLTSVNDTNRAALEAYGGDLGAVIAATSENLAAWCAAVLGQTEAPARPGSEDETARRVLCDA